MVQMESSNSQSLANSPKTQQIDSAQSHNTQENHKGHKFCVDRVRFGIFWAALGQQNFAGVTVLLKPTLFVFFPQTQMGRDMWGVKSEMKCVPHAKQEMKRPHKVVLFEFNPILQIAK